MPKKSSTKKVSKKQAKTTPKIFINPKKNTDIIGVKFNDQHPLYHILNQVIDPELGVGIADMGLIYDVTRKNGIAYVKMTLTSMGCPAGPELTTDVVEILRLEDDVDDVELEVVWEPTWNPDMMKPEIKAMLL